MKTLAYLSCLGAGGSRELGGIIGQLIEAFFLGTSMHDDFLDEEDKVVKKVFRLMEKRFAEFTPDHVRKGLLGIGFATDEEIGKAILRL